MRGGVSSLMLHTVGTAFPQWTWKFLTTPWQIFEGLLRQLQRMGYRTVLLDEYRDIVLAGRLSHEKVVALTFDDGYLDNWVYASVLLERYGMCGTVFVSGEFIDPGEELRPRWDGTSSGSAPESDGFLNIAEMRQLDSSRVLDVQSHCMTHTWYPCGPRIVDFRHPGDPYHWMSWNASPRDKWRSVQPGEKPEYWGEPVYEHQKSLNGLRYFPGPELGEALRLHVAQSGEGFFADPDWRGKLFARAEELQKNLPQGEWEREEDFKARIRSELADSARLLSEILGKKVSWLCWPGGGYSAEVFAMAAEYYEGTTISSSFDAVHKQGLDKHGCFRFSRFGLLHAGEGDSLRYLGPLTNALYVEERRTGSMPCRLIRGGLTRLAQWGIV